MKVFSYIESKCELLSEDHNEQAVIIYGDFNVTSEKIYSVHRHNILKQFFND